MIYLALGLFAFTIFVSLAFMGFKTLSEQLSYHTSMSKRYNESIESKLDRLIELKEIQINNEIKGVHEKETV